MQEETHFNSESISRSDEIISNPFTLISTYRIEYVRLPSLESYGCIIISMNLKALEALLR